jgi:hypothetical protein
MPTLAELREQGVIGAIEAGMNQSAMLARFLRDTAADAVLLSGRYTAPGPVGAGRRPARGFRWSATPRAGCPARR